MDIPGVANIDELINKNAYGKNALGQEDFMRLLLKELSYQDPLNPMDSKEFTVQLTQFSSLEGIKEINNSLNDLLAFQKSTQNTTVTNLIGKSVEVGGNVSYLRGTAEMNYDLADTASSVKIVISDAFGRVVRSETLGPQSAGSNHYIWDGRDDLGNKLPEGPYTFDVEATDIEGSPVESVTRSSGYVTGIDFEEGVTYVVLDSIRRVNLNDIKSIEE